MTRDNLKNMCVKKGLALFLIYIAVIWVQEISTVSNIHCGHMGTRDALVDKMYWRFSYKSVIVFKGA